MTKGVHSRMKKLGIIGGLSPESTITYYAYLTRKYVNDFGNCSYPEIIIYSVSLEKYHQWRNDGRWDLISDDLIIAGRALENAGAEIGLIATNTMHKVFDQVQEKLRIPLINIIDTTINEIKRKDIISVGLLGTRFTMHDDFFKRKLIMNGINALVPRKEQQYKIHEIIENELVKNVINNNSKELFKGIISDLINIGANGIILGCTEIPLLINQNDVGTPLFDTAIIHAESAYQKMIE
jgi:aspartate racemase